MGTNHRLHYVAHYWKSLKKELGRERKREINMAQLDDQGTLTQIKRKNHVKY